MAWLSRFKDSLCAKPGPPFHEFQPAARFDVPIELRQGGTKENVLTSLECGSDKRPLVNLVPKSLESIKNEVHFRRS